MAVTAPLEVDLAFHQTFDMDSIAVDAVPAFVSTRVPAVVVVVALAPLMQQAVASGHPAALVAYGPSDPVEPYHRNEENHQLAYCKAVFGKILLVVVVVAAAAAAEVAALAVAAHREMLEENLDILALAYHTYLQMLLQPLDPHLDNLFVAPVVAVASSSQIVVDNLDVSIEDPSPPFRPLPASAAEEPVQVQAAAAVVALAVPTVLDYVAALIFFVHDMVIAVG